MCINHALLGFYLCHFRRYESIKRFNSVWLNHINIKKNICLAYSNDKSVPLRIKTNSKK